MSRHRNVRSMNYQDEYDGYDDVYGHSVEDDYCVSPATAEQFLYDRNRGHALSSFMTQTSVPEEDEGADEDEEYDPMNDSRNYQRPALSDVDEARLNSCLEEIRNIIGDSTPEHILVDTIIRHKFNYEMALDALLNKQDVHKKPKDTKPAGNIGGVDSSVLGGNPGLQYEVADQAQKSEGGKGLAGTAIPKMDFWGGNKPGMAASPRREGLALQNTPPKLESQQKRVGSALSGLASHHLQSTPPRLGLSSQQNAQGSALSGLASQHLQHTPPKLALSSQQNAQGSALSGLASQHLQNTPPRLGLSSQQNAQGSALSGLASQHLQNTPPRLGLSSQQNVQGSALSGLASQHLQNTPPRLGFTTLQNTQGSALSGLASQHMQNTPPRLGLSLQQNVQGSALSGLASQHLQNTPPRLGLSSQQNVQGSALSGLASQHLQNTPPRLGFTTLQNTQGSALSGLASQHMQNTPPRLGLSLQQNVQGSALSGLASQHLQNKSKISDSEIPKTENEKKSIDLSTAIKEKSSGSAIMVKPLPMKKHSMKPSSYKDHAVPEEIHPSDNVTILINEELLGEINEYQAKPSTFACVLNGVKYMKHLNSKEVKYTKFSYRTQLKHRKSSLKGFYHDLKPFDFSTPSPDDIVKQKQKGAFASQGSESFKTINPDFKLGLPPKSKESHDGNKENERDNRAQGGARLTFSNTKSTTVTGFETNVNHKNSAKVENDKKVQKTNIDENKEVDSLLRNFSTMNLSALKGAEGGEGGAASPINVQKSSSKSKQDQLNVQEEYEKRKAGKDLLNLVVIGHVDAGKSTLMGHLLYQLGCVNKRTMHKYETESKKLGKASFAYAWVLDETEEERTRGVTMDIAQTRFETDHRIVTLLDAPGHKDFIPNMITGAAQADVAVLVVNATRGEFETGFEMGGQTREHALLVRSLGVHQLTVAINKMDTVEWAEERYNKIVKKLGLFLKQAGFKESDVSFIPCSGLSGENLTKLTDPKLKAWYKGGSLLDQIDNFKAPERAIDKPLRMVVNDFYKGMGSGFSIAGRIEAGCVQAGDRVAILPAGESGTVKGVSLSECPVPCAFAGDHAVITVTGVDMTNISVGNIICDPAFPIKAASRFQARVVIFNIEVPITKGFPVVLHYQTLSEPAVIKKLKSQLHKSTGEVVRKKPRCLARNSNAVIELEVNRPICIELYKDYKDLGRFMLRYGGSTIAAGLVTEIISGKSS